MTGLSTGPALHLPEKDPWIAGWVEHVPGLLALLEGPDHRIVMANQAGRNLWGNRARIGNAMADRHPDAFDRGLGGLLDRVFETGEAFSGSGLRYRPSPKATERFIDLAIQPVRDDGGAISGLLVSGIDVTERVTERAALKAGEGQFQAVAQLLSDHVWTATTQGTIDWASDQALAYIGTSGEQLEAGGFEPFLHEDDRAGWSAVWKSARSEGDRAEADVRIKGGDGRYRWFRMRALPVRDETNKIVRWVGTNTDIQDEKAGHDQGAVDRDRMWSMSQDLMLVFDLQGIIGSVNPSSFQLLGWTEDEMVGHNFLDFVHPDDRDRSSADVAALTDIRSTTAFENRLRAKDGGYRTFAWNAVAAEERVHAIGRDVTEERRLARDRDRIWTLSPVLKAVTDASGRLTDVNPSWTKTLGWSREESIGRRSTEFMIDDEIAGTERVKALASGLSLFDYRTKLRTKDGQTRLIEWVTVPENGTFYGFGRDVTAEIEAEAALAETEAALRQSQKMEAIGQLTGGIAHDFNNLLQGIGGSLELLQRRVAQRRIDQLDRLIDGACTAAGRAASLTHRLLAFSRRQPLDPKPVEVNALVSSMEDLLRRTIGEPIALDFALADGLWTTRCDPNQLESAILNLAINARDAMPVGGWLTIETGNAVLDHGDVPGEKHVQPGDYVRLSVSDTGTGMDAATMAKAFEPFFTTKPIGQGTGLGLSMIYGFAQQSEGYAQILSEVGKGTTIKLYLPRFLSPAENDPDAATQAPVSDAQAGEVVLVIEDEQIVRRLVVEELKERGYVVLEAAEGVAGLDILKTDRRIDLLVTDIGLPGLNGRQVSEAARQMRPSLRILFMTGYAENAALASGFLGPGMEMIVKPFQMDVLAGRIRAMIEHRADDQPEH